jgi:hypothetical protein
MKMFLGAESMRHAIGEKTDGGAPANWSAAIWLVMRRRRLELEADAELRGERG